MRNRGHLSTIDGAGKDSLMMIYCTCGRLVTADRRISVLKGILRKEVECSTCRNMRISREIDEIDRHFSGEDAESSEWRSAY